jgi:oligopeptide transport system substrate-binding protein
MIHIKNTTLFRMFRLLSVVCLGVPLSLQSCKCSPDRAEDAGKKIFYSRAEGKAKTLDPPRQYDAYSNLSVMHIFDSLYMYHYLKRPYEIVPNLATGMPEYSADGKVMTIKLRSDVYFHDDKCFVGGKGRKFVANDVAYTLKRFGDTNVNDAGSLTLLTDIVEGYDDYIKKTTAMAGQTILYNDINIPGIQVLDETTIQFKLVKRTPNLFYTLGMAVTAITPKECVDYYGEDFGFHPVGTGPFTISYKNRKGDMVLKKNPRYHLRYPSEGAPGDFEAGLLKDAGKPLPLVDEVVWPVIEEAQPAMLKFFRGSLDWVRIDADSFKSLAQKKADGSFTLKPPYDQKYQLHPGIDLSAYWWVFNMKDPLLGKNLKLRKAMAHAINRQGYVEDIFNGRGVVIDSVIPSSIAGNAEQLGLTFYPYDVAVAKKLLSEAGYPGGKGLPPITFFYAAGSSVQKPYEYIRRNLAEIGIELKLETLPYTAYIKKFSAGAFQFSVGGWNADYLDAENFLMLFTNDALKNELYYGGAWTNPEFEKMIVEIRDLPDGAERRSIIKKMLILINDDVPAIPTFTYNRLNMTAPWVLNWKRNMGNDLESVYVNIDLDRRKKGYAQ